MRESRPYGSVRGARSNARPYRDLAPAVPETSLVKEAAQAVGRQLKPS